MSRPIQGCTPRVRKKLPDTYWPLRVSACAGDPALRTPSGALPACNADNSTKSGVCARPFLSAKFSEPSGNTGVRRQQFPNSLCLKCKNILKHLEVEMF